MPPKTDAFADLFQSANTNSSTRKMKMADLNRASSSNGSNSTMDVFGDLSSVTKPSTSSKPSSNWDEFDLFTSSSSTNVGSSTSSRVQTPSNDSFDIFAKSEPVQAKSVKPSVQNHNSASLLDDEFTDAFHAEPVREPAELKVEETIPQALHQRQYYEDNQFAKQTKSESPTSKRDQLIAELLDVGFPIEASNDAIDHVGLDLQACVNFIMSGGKSSSATTSRQSNRNNEGEDIGAKINEFSTDFFNKASLFLNKSKKTVMKNIEQFQQAQGPRRGSPNNSMPAWMQNQSEYKSKASERNPTGGKFEDYGSDDENIDQDAIRRFMEEQREKDKSRNKARIDNLKSKAKETISGKNSSRSVSPEKSSTSSSSSFTQQPIPTPKSRVESSSKTKISQPQPQTAVKQDADLLGLGGELVSRAQRFKAQANQEEVYVSSRRRRPAATTATATPAKPSIPRKTTRETLDQFSQSDYDTGKEKATEFFSNGNYDDACINYNKCLNALTTTHELRVVINSNLAITYIKLGDYKQAKERCNEGLALISKEEINDNTYIINEKPVKFWYTKLLARKAEALEMLETFSEALECYKELVTLGVNDKKVMDGKRRVNNIVNPPKPQVKSKAKPVQTQPQNNENLKRVQEQNRQQELKDNSKFQYQEQVEKKIFSWANGKEDNLRSLLMSLPEVLPESLGFPFLTTKKIGINDLMLPKKVKINYMKVISSIHPDKLRSLNLNVEHEMLCQSVFVTLNKSWDIFKGQNGIN